MTHQPYFTYWRVGLFGIALAVGIVLALTPYLPAEQLPSLGDVSDRAVVASESVSYISPSMTAAARAEAREAVEPQFELNPDVGPAQAAAIERYFEAVAAERVARSSPFSPSGDNTRSDPTDGDSENALIDGSRLSARDESYLLSLRDSLYANVEQESKRLLEEILSTEWRADEQVGLSSTLPQLIAPTLSIAESAMVASLVTAYLRPTLIESSTLTEQARLRAEQAVPGVRLSIASGDVVVNAGDTVTQAQAEALAQVTPRAAGIQLESLGAVVIIGVGASAIFAIFLMVWRPREVASDRRMVLLALLILFSIIAARLWFEVALPGELGRSIDLMLPLAAGPVLVAALLSTGLGVATGVLIAVCAGLAAIVLPDYAAAPAGAAALRPLLFFLASALGGVFAATRAQALSQYGLAGIAAGLAGFLAGMATWLLDPDRLTDQVGWLALAAFVTAALVSVITIGAFSLLGALFGITTPMRLLELAQLQQPLLRRLQEEAPGTFHHSLLVATMAERAAAQIGADPLLSRVGAYYHDIGKLYRPEMFIENQQDANPHDDHAPSDSAQIIIQHVTGGEELARAGRVPPRIRDFILEHHGSRRVAYFYRQAAMQDRRVDPSDFTYPGPSPQTRETAIVMLADSCEAVVRASGERAAGPIGLLIDGVFDERLRERQLDHCEITLSQLRLISASFKHTLAGVNHQRIPYPPAVEDERRLTPREQPPTSPQPN